MKLSLLVQPHMLEGVCETAESVASIRSPIGSQQVHCTGEVIDGMFEVTYVSVNRDKMIRPPDWMTEEWLHANNVVIEHVSLSSYTLAVGSNALPGYYAARGAFGSAWISEGPRPQPIVDILEERREKFTNITVDAPDIARAMDLYQEMIDGTVRPKRR